MAANTNPVFTLTPNVKGVAVGTAALADSSGAATIGTGLYLGFTAGANGSFVEKVRFHPVATVAATATTATTLRVFISSQAAGTTTQANTWLVAEVSAAAQTADHSTTATFFIDVPLGFAIPAGYTVLLAAHVINASNTSWTGTTIGGDY